jgi:hypothetical protein
MQHSSRCALASLLVVAFVLPLAGCGENIPSPTSPTADVSPSAASGGPPGLTVSALSISGSSVLSQQTTQASVTLTAGAPDSGALVTLSSSNSSAAKVPATVMVASGAVDARFIVEAATVGVSTPVTISASYAGVTRSASLTIRPPVVSAAFTVTSPTRGRGACVLGPSTGAADCVLDGSTSEGPVAQWVWSYRTAGSPIGHSATEANSTMNLATRCRFFDEGRGGTDQNGDRYVQMEIEMYVMDREGTRSASVRQPVRMYPNRLCGFSY